MSTLCLVFNKIMIKTSEVRLIKSVYKFSAVQIQSIYSFYKVTILKHTYIILSIATHNLV